MGNTKASRSKPLAHAGTFLNIIHYMRNCLVFPSYNFIYLYYSTYKDIFASAFLLGYPIQDSLYTAPENIIQKNLSYPTTLYTGTLHPKSLTST